MNQSRRRFLADLGRGMVIASVGSGLAEELGLGKAFAEEPGRLRFGPLDPLVDLMQETAPDRLVSVLVSKLHSGTSLQNLVAAAALANVRTFGGEDYVGFHSMMALAPSYHMARELPTERQALPVLKVLYRNSNRIHEAGGREHEVLHEISPVATPLNPSPEVLREAVRRKDLAGAEHTFARLAQGSPDDALNALLPTVDDATEVHRIVMVYRSWDVLELIGREQAHTVLRQSVHYCVKNGGNAYHATFASARDAVPKLLDCYHLLERPAGQKALDDAALERLSQSIFSATPETAAEVAAAALADGIAPDVIGEAISLAANQLVLRDNGRPKAAGSNKPAGSVHGDGIGVHACDSANAWRNLARVTNPRNRLLCLLLGAYQVARDRNIRGGDFLKWEPYPRAEARDRVRAKDPEGLLREAEQAIRGNDQALACAAVERYGRLGLPPRPVFDLLLRYAVSEDGALHAEKYYRTVTEEFASTRPAYRWRQLVALARVTASAYGYPAAGYADACRLLQV
jgi:hypothetical protein